MMIEARAARPRNHEGAAALDWSFDGGACVLIGPDRSLCRDYLRMLGGVEPPAEGRLQLLGHDMRDLPIEQWRELRTEVGFVTHGAPLLSVLNALDNVMLPLLYHQRIHREQARVQALALLRELGFEDEGSRLPAYYSELQRLQLAIARSLVLEPRLLMLESLPIDPECPEREPMLAFLRQWKADAGLLLVTGNLYFTKHLADAILFVDGDSITAFDSWQRFIDSDVEAVRGYLNRRREQMQIF